MIIGATFKSAPVIIKNILLFLFSLDQFRFFIWQKWIEPFSGPQFQNQADIMLKSSYTERARPREKMLCMTFADCRLHLALNLINLVIIH